MKISSFIYITLILVILSETSIGAELLKDNEFPPLRRYRQHFTSITAWAYYGPSIETDDNPFDSDHLLLSGDENNRIFISDALTGEVYREYDVFVPDFMGKSFFSSFSSDPIFVIGNIDESTVMNSREPIIHLVFSPNARRIAYSVRKYQSADHHSFHVLDTYNNTYIGYELCGELYSLLFRICPIDDCDILEAIYEAGGRTYRKFYAFPLNTTEVAKGHGLLSSFEYKDIDKLKDEIDEKDIEFPGLYPHTSGSVSNGENGIERAVATIGECCAFCPSHYGKAGECCVCCLSAKIPISAPDNGEKPENGQIDDKESLDKTD